MFGLIFSHRVPVFRGEPGRAVSGIAPIPRPRQNRVPVVVNCRIEELQHVEASTEIQIGRRSCNLISICIEVRS